MRTIIIVSALCLFAIAAFIFGAEAYERRARAKHESELLARIGAAAEGEGIFGLQKARKAVLGYVRRSKFASRLLNRCALGVDQIDRQLPDLIDVIGLGMQNGMGFEAAFAMYANRFDTALARECREAANLMQTGVLSRDDALEQMSERLGSDLVSRFVSTVSRSLRYGGQLAPLLVKLSDDVRDEYRSRMEEKVAKAPTKMLLPVGTLILPAMLIMVVGPFLVEFLGQM